MRWTDVLLLTWAGMRGLVTFALVLSLSPTDFPMRDEFTIVAFVVLLCTMVIPGLTLPTLTAYLKRNYDLHDTADHATEEALDDAYRAAVAVVSKELASEHLTPEAAARINERLQVIRSTSALDDGDDGLEDADEHARIRRVRRQKAARRAIEIRRRSLNEAQRSLAASRYRKGVDPSAVAEKMHEIDRRLLALPHEGE